MAIKNFSIQKKLLLIILIAIGLIVFALFDFKHYTLYPLMEKETACYLYQSDEDIKNIARHAIIDKFGEKVLIAQKSLTVSKGESDRYGFLVWLYLEKFIDPIIGKPNANTPIIKLTRFHINILTPIF